MTEPDHSDPDFVMSDLVEYLVIQLPDLDALATVGPAIIALHEDSTIRILDLVAVTTDELGTVREFALDSLGPVGGLEHFVPEHGSLLSARDVRLAALCLPAGTAGVVLVSEDRWAATLEAAARHAGGRIVAGDRISAHRIGLALAHGREPVEAASRRDG